MGEDRRRRAPPATASPAKAVAPAAVVPAAAAPTRATPVAPAKPLAEAAAPSARRQPVQQRSQERLERILSVARELIALHGSPGQRAEAGAQARDGVLFGVWGADGDPPARLNEGRLSGGKRFCSGLGVVGRAVVPVEGQLVLIDAGQPSRQDAAAWTASV